MYKLEMHITRIGKLWCNFNACL